MSKIHEQYDGNVVRIAPDELSFIDPQAWHDIYSYKSKGEHGSPPPKNLFKYLPDLNGEPSLLQDPDDTEHARVRRIFSPAFSDRALMRQAPLFTKYVDQLTRVIREQIEASSDDTAEIDMAQMYSKCIC